jgi:hypothetical protein
MPTTTAPPPNLVDASLDLGRSTRGALGARNETATEIRGYSTWSKRLVQPSCDDTTASGPPHLYARDCMHMPMANALGGSQSLSMDRCWAAQFPAFPDAGGGFAWRMWAGSKWCPSPWENSEPKSKWTGLYIRGSSCSLPLFLIIYKPNFNIRLV